MQMSWDRKYSVRVLVDGRKMDTMCGLCGNFNGDDSDDMVLGQLPDEPCKPNGYTGNPGDMVSDIDPMHL